MRSDSSFCQLPKTVKANPFAVFLVVHAIDLVAVSPTLVAAPCQRVKFNTFSLERVKWVQFIYSISHFTVSRLIKCSAPGTKWDLCSETASVTDSNNRFHYANMTKVKQTILDDTHTHSHTSKQPLSFTLLRCMQFGIWLAMWHPNHVVIKAVQELVPISLLSSFLQQHLHIHSDLDTFFSSFLWKNF